MDDVMIISGGNVAGLMQLRKLHEIFCNNNWRCSAVSWAMHHAQKLYIYAVYGISKYDPRNDNNYSLKIVIWLKSSAEIGWKKTHNWRISKTNMIFWNLDYRLANINGPFKS